LDFLALLQIVLLAIFGLVNPSGLSWMISVRCFQSVTFLKALIRSLMKTWGAWVLRFCKILVLRNFSFMMSDSNGIVSNLARDFLVILNGLANLFVDLTLGFDWKISVLSFPVRDV
jgi:hypothetical protein